MLTGVINSGADDEITMVCAEGNIKLLTKKRENHNAYHRSVEN